MSTPLAERHHLVPNTLNLPSYHRTDPATGKTYVSVVFSSCAISNTVEEILLINRKQCKSPLMYIETPLDIWEQQEMLGQLKRCLTWQPTNANLIDPNFIQFYGLNYDPPLVCYGQSTLDPADQTLIFRPCDLTAADKALVKSVWKLPASTENDIIDDAYHHECSFQRFSDEFIATATKRAGALSLRRATSEYYPLGADYWLFSLQLHTNRTPESAKIAFVTTTPANP